MLAEWGLNPDLEHQRAGWPPEREPLLWKVLLLQVSGVVRTGAGSNRTQSSTQENKVTRTDCSAVLDHRKQEGGFLKRKTRFPPVSWSRSARDRLPRTDHYTPPKGGCPTPPQLRLIRKGKNEPGHDTGMISENVKIKHLYCWRLPKYIWLYSIQVRWRVCNRRLHMAVYSEIHQ